MLGTTGLLKTRVGVVLTSAALLDDVVGLVMVQVINNLGTSTSAFSAVAIIRPVFVSVAFAVMCPLLCWLVLKPVALKLNEWRENKREGLLHRTLCRDEVALILHTALLVGMVAGSSYAGTSNLFAAFLTGAIISWWDTELPHLTPSVVQSQEQDQKASPGTLKESPAAIADGLGLSQSGVTIYEKYYMAANTKVLKPFFFVRGPHFTLKLSLPFTDLYRVFNPRQPYVQWPHSLERSDLQRLNAHREAFVRRLACPPLRVNAASTCASESYHSDHADIHSTSMGQTEVSSPR